MRDSQEIQGRIFHSFACRRHPFAKMGAGIASLQNDWPECSLAGLIEIRRRLAKKKARVCRPGLETKSL